MNKKEKFKWENIKPAENCDFEKNYKYILNIIYILQSNLQQLAGAYKKLDEQLCKKE